MTVEKFWGDDDGRTWKCVWWVEGAEKFDSQSFPEAALVLQTES